MSVTIKMIADQCGVSRGTVDRVINNRGRVSKKTADLVNQAVRELNYKPNMLGKALASRKKQLNIGVVLCSIGNEFYNELIQGIKDAEKKNENYNLQVIYRYMEGYNVEMQLQLIRELKPQINCLIITAIDDEKIAKAINHLEKREIRVITVNTDVSNSRRQIHVGADTMECGQLACSFLGLFHNGESKVLLVTGSSSLLEHRNRIQGFKHYQEKVFPKMNICSIIETEDNDDLAYRNTLKVLSTHPDINAVFIGASGASGVCNAFTEHGLSQAIIVACDTTPTIHSLMQQGLVSATVYQQPWLQGFQALDFAVQHMIEDVKQENLLIRNELKLLANIV